MNLNVNYRANYRVTRSNGGYQFQYFCFLCEYNYTTGWIYADSEDEALLKAEKEARKYFNGCHNCGRWVCDNHYNMGEMTCIDCEA